MDESAAPAKKLSLNQYKLSRATASTSKSPPPENSTLNDPLPRDSPTNDSLANGSIGADVERRASAIFAGTDSVGPAALPLLMRSLSVDAAKISILRFLLREPPSLLSRAAEIFTAADVDALRDVLYNWLKICLLAFEKEFAIVDGGNTHSSAGHEEVCLLALEAVRKLNFTGEYLKASKYMKLLNRFCDEAFVSAVVQQQANELFHVWAKRVAAAKYLGQSTPSATASNAATALSNAASPNGGGVQSTAGDIFPVNAAASRSHGRLLSGSSNAEAALDAEIPPKHSRPLSADEILRDRKRRQLLEPTAPPETAASRRSSSASSTRRVSFAPDDLLVQIRYFVIDDGERISSLRSMHRGKANYHDSERQEASFAFERLHARSQPQVAWRTPLRIALPAEVRAIADAPCVATEVQTQADRERTLLVVTYYTLQHVPPSPAEPPTAAASEERTPIPDALITAIPAFEVTTAAAAAGNATIAAQPTSKLDATMLQSLLQNADLHSLLSSLPKR